MKHASFIKSLSWLIILNLLVKPVWIFFIDRQVQNSVGYKVYGNYFALFNLTYILLFLADGGITNMMNQKLASCQPVHLFSVFRIKAVLLVVYIIACLLAGYLSGIKQWDLLVYLVMVQSLTSAFVFLRGIITARQLFTADAILSVVDKLLMIFLCGGFIYGVFGNINLILFLQLQLICTAFSIGIALFLIKRKELIRVTGEKQQVAAFSRAVLPFTLITLLMSLHYRLDGFLLERLHANGNYEAGVYASGYRLLDAANMVGYLSASFLVPFVARQQLNRILLANTIFTVRQVLLLFAAIVVSFTWVFAPLLQHLLYHSMDSYNAIILKFCLAALPGYFLVHVYGSVLTATANFRLFISVLVYTVLLNAVLNVLLVPHYGAFGCCIAAITTQFFCGITLLVTTSKRLQLSMNIPSLLVILLTFGILLLLFSYASTYLTNVWIILALAATGTLIGVASQYVYLRKKYSLIL
jgi:O-antigen/teichoic acid export membrane protein